MPMLLRSIFSCCAVLMVSMLQAQSRLQVGVRIIPQETSLIQRTPFPIVDYLKIDPEYSRIRWAQGVGLNYQLFNRWSLGSDLLYSLQGGGYASRKTNIDYVKMPFWLGFNTKSTRSWMFNVQSGFDIAYMVSAKMKYEDGETVDISRYLHRFNWGVPFAMGIKFRIWDVYYWNTQLFLYTDFVSLSKTDPSYHVTDYTMPGIRFGFDRRIGKD